MVYTHALSVDVEDFASAAILYALKKIINPSDDVVRLTDRLMSILSEYGAKATFFILGDVADAFPELVKRISSEGHEIGVHGWHHHRVFQLKSEDYREGLYRAKSLLQDLTGKPVIGYRAVAMSINKSTYWAYDILTDIGFKYSSSIFPFRGLSYGMPNSPLFPHQVTSRNGLKMLEIPLTVIQFGPLRLPALGGGYLRHLPLLYSKLALKIIEKENRSAVIYLHPYEFDDNFSIKDITTKYTSPENIQVKRFIRGQLRNRSYTEKKIRWILKKANLVPLNVQFKGFIDQIS